MSDIGSRSQKPERAFVCPSAREEQNRPAQRGSLPAHAGLARRIRQQRALYWQESMVRPAYGQILWPPVSDPVQRLTRCQWSSLDGVTLRNQRADLAQQPSDHVDTNGYAISVDTPCNSICPLLPLINREGVRFHSDYIPPYPTSPQVSVRRVRPARWHGPELPHAFPKNLNTARSHSRVYAGHRPTTLSAEIRETGAIWIPPLGI